MDINLGRDVDKFYSSQEVIAHFRQQVRCNGDADLAGLEEEIIVLDAHGKPLAHTAFQNLLDELLASLPGGETQSGDHINGGLIPTLCGSFDGGMVQPETNTTLVEYAHAPTRNSWDCLRLSQAFTEQLRKITQRKGYALIGSGMVPTVEWGDFLKDDVVIPNKSFAYSWENMTKGMRPEYCRTVFGTASIHHNMGFSDPDDMARYITTTLRLQPTMVALLGNSPLWNMVGVKEDGQNLLSNRSRVQIDYGKIFTNGTGLGYLYPDFMIDTEATFESIVDGYLKMPLDRTIVDGKKVYCNGLTMRDFLQGHNLNGRTHFPSEDALTMMVREPIVDVRPSFTGSAPRVETRAHDNVSQPVAVAIDAFYRGIRWNLEEAAELVSGVSADEIRRSRLQVCFVGLNAELCHRDRSIRTQQAIALKALDIAKVGLQARRLGEEVLLSPLLCLAESGRNPAERLMESIRGHEISPKSLLSKMDYAKTSFADGQSYDWPGASL